DIKPGNAMHADDGRILLMDFGLSHELHQKAQWGGTLDFMAPELLGGGEPSVQSDIYAMGVLLHYLCTGRMELGKTEAQRASESDPEIAPALRQVIGTATNADPKARYSSAAKLRDALAATVATPARTV